MTYPSTTSVRRLLTFRALLTVAMVLAATFAVACDSPADAIATSETVMLEGTFSWTLGGDDPADITARITPRSEPNRWNAEFRFRFNGTQHKWNGILDHRPSAPTDRPFVSGSVTGDVTSGRGRRKRNWRIQGTIKEGLLVAEHAELQRSGQYETSGELRLQVLE